MIDKNTEKLMDMVSEDEVVLGTILLDTSTMGCLFNIPLLAKLNPNDEKIAILQKSIDLFQQFFIEALLSDEELEQFKKEIEELKEAEDVIVEDVELKEEDLSE